MPVKMLLICRSSPDLWSNSHHRNHIMTANILNIVRTRVRWSVHPKRFMLCVSDAKKIVIDRHERDCGFYNESKILHKPCGLHVFYCHDAMITIIIHLLKQAKACRSRSNIPFWSNTVLKRDERCLSLESLLLECLIYVIVRHNFDRTIRHTSLRLNLVTSR